MDGSRVPRSQKLKDSCDMCSASKVKCNREKPACGRCKKLGYPCFYSPARRMGRPHPHRSRPSQETFELQPARRRQSINRSRDDAFQFESNLSALDQQSQVLPNSRDRPPINIRGSDDEFNGDQVLGLRGCSTAQNAQMYCPRPEDCATDEPHLTPPNHGLEDVAMFIFDEQSDGADGVGGEEPFFQSLANNESNFNNSNRLQFSRDPATGNEQGHFPRDPFTRTDSPQIRDENCATLNLACPMHSPNSVDLLNTLDVHAARRTHDNTAIHRHSSARQGTSTSTASQFSSTLSAVGDFVADDSEGDCAAAAMDLLHQLHLLGNQPRRSSTASDHVSGLLDVISAAINRVSVIIACPCSRKADVGLLTIAVCTSILETYGSLLRNSRINCASTMTPVSDDDEGQEGTRDREGIKEVPCTETRRVWPLEQEATIRVLGELPRIAQLLTQFSRNSTSHDNIEENAEDLLSALVADLKSKLRFTTSEVVNWLTQT